MKALIVTADDFGISRNINKAVIRAFREGILTSASLVVGGAAFEDAVELARANPGLSVGLHLVLVQGKSVLPHEKIPRLTDSSGNFADNAALAGLRYFFSPAAAGEIREEIRAQIEKYLSTGLPLDFINGHLNIHVHPSVFNTVMGLCRELEIKNFRLPREGLFSTLSHDGSRLMYKLSHYAAFTLLSKRCAATLKGNGFFFADRVYGLLQSGDMNVGYVSTLIKNMPQGVNELYFHPCVMPCAEYSRRMPDYHPEEELNTLTSREITGLLRTHSIDLANYRLVHGTS